MDPYLRFLRERPHAAFVLLVGLVLAVSWLKHRFGAADARRGVAIALAHRPDPGGPSVLEALAARGEGAPRCDGEIVSAFFGDVRVRCTTPAAPEVRYDFRVLVGGRQPLEAESEAARRLVAD